MSWALWQPRNNMATEAIPVDADVNQSFVALKDYFTPESRSDAGSNLSQLVVFAERVLKVINSVMHVQYALRRSATMVHLPAQNGHKQIAGESIDLYLSLRPPSNQFLVRAYLCRAQVLAPASSSQEVSMVVKCVGAMNCCLIDCTDSLVTAGGVTAITGEGSEHCQEIRVVAHLSPLFSPPLLLPPLTLERERERK